MNVTIRPWRFLYTVSLTLWAVYALGWPAALFMLAVQIDINDDGR